MPRLSPLPGQIPAAAPPPPRVTPLPGQIPAAAPPARPSPGAASPPAAAPAARPAAARPQPPKPTAPEGDLSEQRIRQIYAKYVEAKRSANESTAGVTYEKLAASLRAQTSKLRATHPAKSVDYDVVVKDGKAHLKPILR